MGEAPPVYCENESHDAEDETAQAVGQYVWATPDYTFAISEPLCEVCLEEVQPAEIVGVYRFA